MEKSIFACILLCGTVLFGCGNKTGLEEVNIPKVETIQKEQQNKYDKTISILEHYVKTMKKDGYTVEYEVYDREHPLYDGYDTDEIFVFVKVKSDELTELIEYAINYGETKEIKDCLKDVTVSVYKTLNEKLKDENLKSNVSVNICDDEWCYTEYNKQYYADYIDSGLFN